MNLPGHGSSDDTALSSYEADIAEIERAWPDARPIDAYQRSSEKPGDAEADAMLAEIKHRNLDF